MRLRIYAEAESNASLLAIAGARQYTPPAPQPSLAALAVSPSAFPPPGKVPGISTKTVHFPPRPAGAPALQASLAVLAVSTSGESAGLSGENGSLSPAAGWGTGSTGLSGGTWHFHLRGKCRVFPRKRFTFPRGLLGYRLHRPLWPHPPFPPPGKVPGFSAKTVHFPPWLEWQGRHRSN